MLSLARDKLRIKNEEIRAEKAQGEARLAHYMATRVKDKGGIYKILIEAKEDVRTYAEKKQGWVGKIFSKVADFIDARAEVMKAAADNQKADDAEVPVDDPHQKDEL